MKYLMLYEIIIKSTQTSLLYKNLKDGTWDLKMNLEH